MSLPGFADGTREPRFDSDAEIGYQGELFVEGVVEALKRGYGEVKTDERAASTGNVFIESECRYRDGWGPSGIQTTESTIWTFVIGRTVAVSVPVDILRHVWEVGRAEGLERGGGQNGTHPTRGVVMPIHKLFVYALAEAKRRIAT
jgi:hypothetical protein